MYKHTHINKYIYTHIQHTCPHILTYTHMHACALAHALNINAVSNERYKPTYTSEKQQTFTYVHTHTQNPLKGPAL